MPRITSDISDLDSDTRQIADNVRLLHLIRDDPAWALSRVQRAAELEAGLKLMLSGDAGKELDGVIRRLSDENEDLRYALQWAMSNVNDPRPEDGEYAEDHGAATRLAWPDDPDRWS